MELKHLTPHDHIYCPGYCVFLRTRHQRIKLLLVTLVVFEGYKKEWSDFGLWQALAKVQCRLHKSVFLDQNIEWVCCLCDLVFYFFILDVQRIDHLT